MKVEKRMGVAALCGVVMLWTAVACGSPAADNRASEPEPRETEIVGQSPDRRATAKPAQVVSQPTETPEPRMVGMTATRSVPTITPPSPTMTATEEATATPKAEATRLTDGQVYVAPRQVPTDTPVPTPSPTLDPGVKPTTIWSQFTRERYEVLIPDPALGVSWGHEFDRRPVMHEGEEETTPDGLRRYEHRGGGHEQDMLRILAQKMLDGVTGIGRWGYEDWNFRKTRLYVKDAAVQWEWVHPEIPLARMIIEAELYSEEIRRRHEWESFAKDLDPEYRNHPNFEHDRYWHELVPEIRVWRAGAHFILKDTYEQRGKVWVTIYEPELIGPVVVEETTCAGMLMPDRRYPTLGALCSQ